MDWRWLQQFVWPQKETFHFPAPRLLLMLLPAFLQVLLLHPVFSQRISRIGRLLLAPATIYSALHESANSGFRPKPFCNFLNVAIGLAGANFAMRGAEWGLARDLTPYTWVGYAEDYEAKTKGDDKAPAFLDKDRLEQLRAKQAKEDSVIDIVKNSLHLLTSLRGIGYAFSPAPRQLAKPFKQQTFLPVMLAHALLTHGILLICVANLALTSNQRLALLREITTRTHTSWLWTIKTPEFLQRIPSEHDNLPWRLTAITKLLSLSQGCFSILTLGHSLSAIGFYFIINIMRALPIPRQLKPAAFDAREWPSLFQTPYYPQSLGTFWSNNWHALFSRPFRFLALRVAYKQGLALGGPRLARDFGVLAVFALTSWFHEYGILAATNWAGRESIPWWQQYGATIFLMLSGFGICLERAFTAATGINIRGPLGFVWSVTALASFGFFIYQGWLRLGILQGLPPPDRWTWERFAIPFACLFPKTIFTK